MYYIKQKPISVPNYEQMKLKMETECNNNANIAKSTYVYLEITLSHSVVLLFYTLKAYVYINGTNVFILNADRMDLYPCHILQNLKERICF